jgi:hypothetical protein
MTSRSEDRSERPESAPARAKSTASGAKDGTVGGRGEALKAPAALFPTEPGFEQLTPAAHACHALGQAR